MTSSSCATSKDTSQPLRFATIEPKWQGEICVCAGSGPSLCREDLIAAHNSCAKLICVNDAIRLAPWADVLYAPDGAWWKRYDGAASLPCYTLDPAARLYFPHVKLLNFKSGDGLSLDPSTVMTGGHGGYQAINVAAHYRPRRIVLLGYDMQPAADGRHHFFGNHADGSHVNYEYKLGVYHSLVKPLADLGIEIVNASRVSAIDAFPRVSLAAALAD